MLPPFMRFSLPCALGVMAGVAALFFAPETSPAFGQVAGQQAAKASRESAGPQAAARPGPEALTVQAVTDGKEIALRFTWRSSRDAFGLLHDLMRFNGQKWDKAGDVNEDRLSLMMAAPGAASGDFAAKGCLASCHKGQHYLPSTGKSGDYGLDLWHWRGARSSPLGLAEDTFVGLAPEGSDKGMRKADSPGVPPTAWLSKSGDGLRMSQPLATEHVLDGKKVLLPEFVFDPAKNSGFFFLNDGKRLSTPETLAEDAKRFGPAAQAAGRLQHGLVATGMKANALRVADLDPKAKDEVARQALAGGIVPKTVLFDYGSDQHDIASAYAFDPKTRTVSLVLTRALDTGSGKDASLAALTKGEKVVVGAAVHDGGATGAKHLTVNAFTLGKSGAEVSLRTVPDVGRTNWSAVPAARLELAKP